MKTITIFVPKGILLLGYHTKLHELIQDRNEIGLKVEHEKELGEVSSNFHLIRDAVDKEFEVHLHLNLNGENAHV